MPAKGRGGGGEAKAKGSKGSGGGSGSRRNAELAIRKELGSAREQLSMYSKLIQRMGWAHVVAGASLGQQLGPAGGAAGGHGQQQQQQLVAPPPLQQGTSTPPLAAQLLAQCQEVQETWRLVRCLCPQCPVRGVHLEHAEEGGAG